jgi:membrane fusion protein, multidrug efflux system
MTTTKDTANIQPVATAAMPPPSQRRNRILAGIGILAAVAAGISAYWFFEVRGTVFTDDARLAGHLVDVAPELNGRLIQVTVREGQSVHRGDILFNLDPITPQVAVSHAEAVLESAKAAATASQARYDKAMNGSRPEEIKAADATVKRLQNEEDLAQLELGRFEKMKQDDAVPQDKLDRATSALESARQSRENAAQNLSLLQQGSRKEDIAAAQADVELAKSHIAEAAAALQKAKRDLELCSVQAPFDGVVVRRWLDPGAMLMPGQPVVSLFDPATLRVDANIEEKHLNRIRIGDNVDMTVDAYPDLHLKGQVMDILRATNSKFSLIPAEGVSGTFIKVTQRVPLRISIEAPADLHLGPGLSVEVRIRTGTAGKAER